MLLGDMLGSADNVLARFTRDLTADARGGRLDPVRCRADEIARVMDILLRQGKNNPALVGPAGVGKTAIAEGLAQRLAAGDVPLSLRGVRVLALDHVSLLAGTMYRGQYEERIRALVAECTAAPDVVLFIDELHNLIGQGTAMGVAMDAGNMLKPALVRGDFRVIGATTGIEYDRWVCGDPALERRFQKVTVRELSGDETLEILRARKRRLERHHNVVIADEALDAALRLTDEHITDRLRPDRAIDVLDEACAHAHAVARYSPALERVIGERRQALRAAGRDPAAAGPAAAGQAEATGADASHTDEGRDPRDEEPGGGADGRESAPAGTPDDAIERFARDGFAAIERFGAEIEALFAGGLAGESARAPSAPRTAEAPPATPEAAPERNGGASRASRPSAPHGRRPAARLAELELELERLLMEEGIVVRGHDIARVVRLASGRSVTWVA